MIPLVIPPLTNLRVLVTRPVHQAQSLCAAITKLGGEAIHFPVLDIKRREITLIENQYELAVFVSANAVTHGVSTLQQLTERPLIAAIGKATASALQAAGVEVAITAPPPFNSEALLQHEAMQSPPKSILLIKGLGGRDLLRDSLVSRGATVMVAEVYERVAASVSETAQQALNKALHEGTIDVISITSIDIAEAFASLLDQTALLSVQACTVLAGSRRIADQLPSMGWQGEIVVSDSPDDESMLATLKRWHARARN